MVHTGTRAYVTLLSTLSYLPGVIVLHESLLRVRSSFPLLVGVSKELPDTVDALLQARGMQVTRLPDSMRMPMSQTHRLHYWGHTFDKLHVFGLTDFDKLVYIDSDMMVLANIDELFEKPHMSAVAAGHLVHPEWVRLSAGLMVIEPEHSLPQQIAGTFQQALNEVGSTGPDAIGDQDLINAFYPNWPSATALHLDDAYNCFHTHLDIVINRYGYGIPTPTKKEPKPIRVVHFIGRNKPWMKWARLRVLRNTIRRRASTVWERKAFRMYVSLLKRSRSRRHF